MFCDPHFLRRSLEDRLSEAEEEALSAHLSHCEQCQHALEQFAGQPETWTRIGTVLRDACSSGASSLSTPGIENAVEPDIAADFAVECLEPSTSPESIGRLGDTEILEVIGHGGFGVVLKGFQP